jgi:hypothetical protein
LIFIIFSNAAHLTLAPSTAPPGAEAWTRCPQPFTGRTHDKCRNITLLKINIGKQKV